MMVRYHPEARKVIMKYVRKTPDEKYLLGMEKVNPKNFSDTTNLLSTYGPSKTVDASEFTQQLFSRAPKHMFRFYGDWVMMSNPPGYHKNDDMQNKNGLYTPTKKRIYIAGGGFPPIEHEVAHFLEMNNLERLTYCDMGMSTEYPLRAQTPYEISNKYIKDNVVNIIDKKMGAWWTGWMRELRTRQIQLHLLDKPIVMAKTMDDVTDNHHLHFERYFKSFGRFQSTQEVTEYVIDQTNKIRLAWSRDRIVHEFDRRVNYLREWMETK